MNRLNDVLRLYEILAELEVRLGGARQLQACNGRMAWPDHGVYFFFEPGELRSTSGRGPRVVRVGTHALSASSRTRLWTRLSQHRGTASTGAGNHRGSAFRYLVGQALIRRGRMDVPTWGVGGTATAAAEDFGISRTALLERELPVEVAVSRMIGAMPFLWVRCEDVVGGRDARDVIERNAIGLLSNRGGQALDAPSATWLGAASPSALVRESGVWNKNYVDDGYDQRFLKVLARAARRPRL